jgi:hypothetical protein
MMLSIRYHGAGRYSLADAGNEIGTIHGRSLRIVGFDTEADAAEARHAGFVALLRWIALRSGTARRGADAPGIEEPGRDGRGGGAPAMHGGGSVIARVLRPTPDERQGSSRGAYSVEFQLPPGLYAAVALHAAQTIYGAIHTTRERRGSVAAPAGSGIAMTEAAAAPTQ